MKVHDLKITPEYLTKIFQGNKNWELRKNDRGFKEGDLIFVREYENGEYLMQYAVGHIVFVLENYTGIETGYCILSVEWACRDDIRWIPEIKQFMQERGLK